MRLIDAERLKADVFKASMDEHFMPMKLLDCDTVTEIINTAPTIEERKTARRINRISLSDCQCSACLHWIATDDKYCWQCGAKMEVDDATAL